MIQNIHLTFYFELKLQVRRTENISLTEICRLLASCCAVVTSTPIMGRIRASSHPWGRWRQTHDLVNEHAPSGLCPFYSGQVMKRGACSSSACLNPFYDMFMTRLWKGENLRQFTS